MEELLIRSFGISDTGRRRKNNEDSILVSEEEGLFILADGMGGHHGGEIASGMAIEVISEVFANQKLGDNFPKEAEQALSGLDGDAQLIKGAIIETNERIVQRAIDDDELEGMGSTVDTMVTKDGMALIAHVGDSRVYRYNAGAIYQVTRDHSVFNDLVDHHNLTPEVARQNPYHKRVTNALGYLRNNRVDIFEEKLKPKDIFLLCSDGLTDVVSDDEIASIISKSAGNPIICCQALIGEANERGGPDNVSVIIVTVGFEDVYGDADTTVDIEIDEDSGDKFADTAKGMKVDIDEESGEISFGDDTEDDDEDESLELEVGGEENRDSEYESESIVVSLDEAEARAIAKTKGKTGDGFEDIPSPGDTVDNLAEVLEKEKEAAKAIALSEVDNIVGGDTIDDLNAALEKEKSEAEESKKTGSDDDVKTDENKSQEEE